MLTELFAFLSRAVGGPVWAALAAAGAWGVLSVVLSPCHLASIPLVVGYLAQQGPVRPRRAMALSVVFATGILITIAAMGGATAAAGRLLGDAGGWVNWLMAALLIGIGLVLLDVIRLPAFGAPTTVVGGLGGAFLLGLVFGAALGPCTFAFLAPVLAVALQAARARPVVGPMLPLAYGVGHRAVIAAAGTGLGGWSGSSRGTVTRARR